MGGLILVILGAQGGKNLEFFEKKVITVLQIKINCTKFVLKCHIYIIQL